MRQIRAALVVVVGSVGLLGCAAVAPTADQTGNGQALLALTDVTAQRVLLADTVAAAKWGTDAPINDPAREQVVLDAAAARSVPLGVDPAVARAVFTDQIEANKTVQSGLYSQWRAQPRQAPTARPALGEIRPVLDRITDQLLAELKATQQLRAQPTCAAELTGARHRVERARHLDPLHAGALARALISICR